MRLFLAMAALGSATMAIAADGERLVGPPLSGFVVGHSAANAGQSIREEIRTDETVQRWTRMVTTQRFTGLAARSTPAAYARRIAGQLPQACPGATISPIASLSVGGRPASRFQVDCPRSQSGVSETFILLAIAGQRDMHVKQVAFRGAKTAANLAWARGFLAGTTLCQPRDRRPACN